MKTPMKFLVAGLAALAVAGPAAAEVDFAGETIEFSIPFSEKGGSARWANFFAPLLSEALPGKPTVVVKYRPGAGSTKGANWFQEQDVKDGTVIFGTSGSTHFPYLLGDPRVRYEIKDWIPVMASGTGGVAYLRKEIAGGFDGSANGLKGGDYIFGSQGATRLDLIPLLSFKMLGMNVEPVFGIKSRGDGRLMFERGEANVDYQTSSAYLSSSMPMVESGLAVPMMSWGSVDDDGNIVRRPSRKSAKKPAVAIPPATRSRPGRVSSPPASRCKRSCSCPTAPTRKSSTPTSRPLKRSARGPISRSCRTRRSASTRCSSARGRPTARASRPRCRRRRRTSLSTG